MAINHTDIVQRERASMDPTSAESILACLVRVVKALPPDEKGGLLRKDAGENILFYPPTNCNVSISRVCYPDGQLYKIFTDAGPNGANGPAWNNDGTVEPSRYLNILGDVPPPPPAPDLSELIKRVQGLESTVDRHATELTNAELANIALAKRVAILEAAPAFELPELQVEGDTSRAWGHGHRVKLMVTSK